MAASDCLKVKSFSLHV